MVAEPQLRRRPRVVVMDVNETLSDLSPLGERIAELGAPPALLAGWLPATLRDGFALTLAGEYVPFAEVGRATMRALLAGEPGLRMAPEEAADHVLAGLGELGVHADVVAGLRRLQAAGLRIVTLSNGAAENAQRLLERAGVAGAVEGFLSVDSVRRWKPAPEPYRFAAERCGVLPEEMLLAAVHPWDTDGARRAGLRACWIDRAGTGFPGHFPAPELTCASLEELAATLRA